MKKYILLILLLLLVFACKDGDDGTTVPPTDDTTTTPVETPPVVTPPVVTEPPVTHPPVTQPPVVVTPTWTEEFIDLVNNHRRSKGLRELTHVPELGDIAENHSVDLATGRVTTSHGGLDKRCDDGFDILGGGSWCGENVAEGQRTPKEAFNWWMNSKGHRDNIELPRYTHTGFGYTRDSNGRYYWTQIFWEH